MGATGSEDVSGTKVVVGIGPHLLGLPSNAVQEMFLLHHVARPPGLGRGQRGIVTLRNRTFPVLDLRVILGLPSAESEVNELVRLLQDREQDHREWMTDLEASVRDRRPFELATDPRQCKFGQWYYAFRTDNVVLSGQLHRFEEPHARVHRLAAEVASMRESGREGAVAALLAQARSGALAELLELFEATRAIVRQEHREIGVLVEVAKRPIVLAVDRAEAVKKLDAFEGAGDPLAESGLRVDLFRGLARWGEKPVFLLDLERAVA